MNTRSLWKKSLRKNCQRGAALVVVSAFASGLLTTCGREGDISALLEQRIEKELLRDKKMVVLSATKMAEELPSMYPILPEYKKDRIEKEIWTRHLHQAGAAQKIPAENIERILHRVEHAEIIDENANYTFPHEPYSLLYLSEKKDDDLLEEGLLEGDLVVDGFSAACGRKELEATARSFTKLHEEAHIGDPVIFPSNMRKVDAPELVLEKEVYADVKALQALLYQDKSKLWYVQFKSDVRAMSAAVGSDATHYDSDVLDHMVETMERARDPWAYGAKDYESLVKPRSVMAGVAEIKKVTLALSQDGTSPLYDEIINKACLPLVRDAVRAGCSEGHVKTLMIQIVQGKLLEKGEIKGEKAQQIVWRSLQGYARCLGVVAENLDGKKNEEKDVVYRACLTSFFKEMRLNEDPQKAFMDPALTLDGWKKSAGVARGNKRNYGLKVEGKRHG